jgi:hypothetical protein
VANCGQSNFSEGYGCLPVNTTGATITGTPKVGQYFAMYGDLSNLPNITATTISYASTPFSSSAPVATATPAGTYWSGTVSGITGSGFVANCGQSNFAEGYGCLPVTTTGATISGTPKVGQFFQLWGDLSNLPTIIASTVNFGSTQFPTTAPSSSPTSSPTSTSGSTGSSGTYDGFANASDYSTNFTPYATNSIWRTPVSANPTIASYSSAVVAAQFPNGRNVSPVRANEAGQWDYNHPRFFASASDPLVNVACTQYCGATDNGGVPLQMHVPAQARPAEGGDGHFDVVQPDGTEVSMWAAGRPSSNWTSGATLYASTIANCGSFGSGQGWLSGGPGPTAAGYCDDAGIVTAAELAAGQINHALFIVAACAVGSQYPTQYGAVTDRCTSGVGPPLGGREWYDVPCSTTQSDGSLHPWEKAILCALNQYGGYLGDDGSGGAYVTGVAPMLESEEPWYDFYGQNYTSPFAPLASQGWYPIVIQNARSGASGTRWVGADPWQPGDVNFPAHIHWLDACSARGTC